VKASSIVLILAAWIDIGDMILSPSLKFSADESYYRILFGLLAAAAMYSCVKCLHVRGTKTISLPRITHKLSADEMRVCELKAVLTTRKKHLGKRKILYLLMWNLVRIVGTVSPTEL
jgi:hypothetical protein